MAAKMLGGAGITLDKARVALNLTPKTLVINMGAKGYSETAKLTLKMAYDVAQDYNQDFCGTEHILYSILSQKNARATILLRDMGIDIDRLTAELENFLSRQKYEEGEQANSGGRRSGRKGGKKGTLEQFSTDLTMAARGNKLDPVVGRENQIK